MALDITGLHREFKFTHNGNAVSLPDPDPGRSPEQVMQFYANQYPSLTTATVHGPEMTDDGVLYEFKTTFGAKG